MTKIHRHFLPLSWVFFQALCQEFIFDTKDPDTRFDQYLQGFCVLKIVPTVGCGFLADCATIRRKHKIYEFDRSGKELAAKADLPSLCSLAFLRGHSIRRFRRRSGFGPAAAKGLARQERFRIFRKLDAFFRVFFGVPSGGSQNRGFCSGK